MQYRLMGIIDYKYKRIMEYTIDLIKKDIERQKFLLTVYKNEEFSKTYIERIESLNKTLLILNGVVRQSEQLKDSTKPTFEEWAVLNGYTDVTFAKIKRGIKWFDYMKVREIYNKEIENL